METQQDIYIARSVKTWSALHVQHWVKEKLIGGGGDILAKKVVFSKKNEEQLARDILEAREIKDRKFLQREAAKDSEVRATEGRRITNEVKFALFSLLIKLGQKVYFIIF